MTYSNLKVEGVRITAFDLTVPKTFNFFDIITEVQSERIGQLNAQFPFFTAIHLQRPTSTITVKYLPWVSSTASYIATESTTNVTVSAFNSNADVLFSTYHRHPLPWPEGLPLPQ